MCVESIKVLSLGYLLFSFTLFVCGFLPLHVMKPGGMYYGSPIITIGGFSYQAWPSSRMLGHSLDHFVGSSSHASLLSLGAIWDVQISRFIMSCHVLCSILVISHLAFMGECWNMKPK